MDATCRDVVSMLGRWVVVETDGFEPLVSDSILELNDESGHVPTIGVEPDSSTDAVTERADELTIILPGGHGPYWSRLLV